MKDFVFIWIVLKSKTRNEKFLKNGQFLRWNLNLSRYLKFSNKLKLYFGYFPVHFNNNLFTFICSLQTLSETFPINFGKFYILKNKKNFKTRQNSESKISLIHNKFNHSIGRLKWHSLSWFLIFWINLFMIAFFINETQYINNNDQNDE